MKYNAPKLRSWAETNPDGDMFVNFSLWNRLYQDFTTREKKEFLARYEDYRRKGFANKESQCLAMKTLLTVKTGKPY